jgi:hypothetical protein
MDYGVLAVKLLKECLLKKILGNDKILLF